MVSIVILSRNTVIINRFKRVDKDLTMRYKLFTALFALHSSHSICWAARYASTKNSWPLALELKALTTAVVQAAMNLPLNRHFMDLLLA